jgi:hypothetical protein
MNIRAMLTTNTLLGMIFGIGFLLLPSFVLPLFGMPANPAATLMTQLLGAALIGLSVAVWLVRDSSLSPQVRAIVVGLLIFNVLGFIVSLLAVLSGVTNSLGWILPAALLIEALPRVYFLFLKPAWA